MERIIAAIEEERAHVVVFGERGSGKTSLCNISPARRRGGLSHSAVCVQHGITFEEIFRNFMARLPGTFLAEGSAPATTRREFRASPARGAFGVTELVEVFARIHDRHVILIIDEYDRVEAEEVKNKLAELMKIMSDASVPVTLLLIGVADDVRHLFGKHPSLQRTLPSSVPMLHARRDREGLIAPGDACGADLRARGARAIIITRRVCPTRRSCCALFAAQAGAAPPRQVEREDLPMRGAPPRAEFARQEVLILRRSARGRDPFQGPDLSRPRGPARRVRRSPSRRRAAASRPKATARSALQMPSRKLTEPEPAAASAPHDCQWACYPVHPGFAQFLLVKKWTRAG